MDPGDEAGETHVALASLAPPWSRAPPSMDATPPGSTVADTTTVPNRHEAIAAEPNAEPKSAAPSPGHRIVDRVPPRHPPAVPLVLSSSPPSFTPPGGVHAVNAADLAGRNAASMLATATW